MCMSSPTAGCLMQLRSLCTPLGLIATATKVAMHSVVKQLTCIRIGMGLCLHAFAFMHYPYIVCILFGMPSLHLFTFLKLDNSVGFDQLSSCMCDSYLDMHVNFDPMYSVYSDIDSIIPSELRYILSMNCWHEHRLCRPRLKVYYLWFGLIIDISNLNTGYTGPDSDSYNSRTSVWGQATQFHSTLSVCPPLLLLLASNHVCSRINDIQCSGITSIMQCQVKMD